jgi:hypothetical protein
LNAERAVIAAERAIAAEASWVAALGGFGRDVKVGDAAASGLAGKAEAVEDVAAGAPGRAADGAAAREGRAAETVAREVDRAPEVVGSGSGSWMEGVAAQPGGAPGQITNGSRVSACGEMLSRGLRTQQELLN